MARKKKQKVRTIEESIRDLTSQVIPLTLEGADGEHRVYIHRPGAEVGQLISEGGSANLINILALNCIKDSPDPTTASKVFTSLESIAALRQQDLSFSAKITTAMLRLVGADVEFETKNSEGSRS